MDAGGTDYIIATYREIAAHFGLKGPVQARVKAKRAGWPAEPQNHPADALRIRVPRDAWNAGLRQGMESLPRPVRNPLSHIHIPDPKNEIRGIIKGFETALETLQQQLERERERADRAEAELVAQRSRADQAEGELDGVKLGLEHMQSVLAQARQEAAEAAAKAEQAARAVKDANERLARLHSRGLWARVRNRP
jgi:DNA repair exonuclease SbcCD ATPase subunit